MEIQQKFEPAAFQNNSVIGCSAPHYCLLSSPPHLLTIQSRSTQTGFTEVHDDKTVFVLYPDCFSTYLDARNTTISQGPFFYSKTC